MNGSRQRRRSLPLTTRQGILLSLAIGIFVALVFAFVFYIYAAPMLPDYLLEEGSAGLPFALKLKGAVALLRRDDDEALKQGLVLLQNTVFLLHAGARAGKTPRVSCRKFW